MTERGRVYTTIDLAGREAEVAERLGRINLDNLREEIQTAGADALWWGTIHADAKRKAGQAKLTLDVLQAQLRRAVRVGAVTRGEKMTVDAVQDEVLADSRYQQAAQEFLRLQEAADLAESAKYAVVQKTRTLESLTGLLFQEEAARREPRTAIDQPPRRQSYRPSG